MSKLPNNDFKDDNNISGENISENADGVTDSYKAKRFDEETEKQANSSVSNNSEDTSGYIFEMPTYVNHHHSGKKKRRKRKKAKGGLVILRNVLIAVLAVLLLAVGTVTAMHYKGKKDLLDNSDMNIEPPKKVQNVVVNDRGKTIEYNGKVYTYNENMTSFLFIGVDRETDNFLAETPIGSAGQADVIFVAALDTQNQKVTLIPVSRDLVAEYNVYSESGEFINTQTGQICLSYAYGNGLETSCENTVTAVSRLFYNIPINSYFAMSNDGIGLLADAIGGVTVTSLMDFETRPIYVGDEVTLFGRDAATYVRYRDITVLDSNNDRMARQKQFLEQFIAQTISKTKEDISTPLDLYNVVLDNAVTNITPSKVTYLAVNTISKLEAENDIEYKSIEGEVVKSEEGYAEFHPDDTKLFELVLDTYYICE